MANDLGADGTGRTNRARLRCTAQRDAQLLCENRAAVAGSIGIFGTYTVDADGRFSGNRVEGATFPNWVGDVRTTDDLRFVVDGNRMTENFTRPDGTRITITFERAS